MRKTKKGFTLIELVVVIGIVALLAAVLIPSIWSSMTSSKEKADEAAIENLSTTIQTGIQNSKIFKNAKKIADESNNGRITFVYAADDNGVLTYQSCEIWKTVDGVTSKVTNYSAGGTELQELSQQIQDFVNGRVEPITFQSDYYKEYAYKITIEFTEIDFKVKSSWEAVDKNLLPAVNCDHTSTSIENATPSCDEITYNVTTCNTCGHQEFEEVQPIGHDLSYTESAATCIQNGQRLSVCSRCDYENVETLPMVDHNYITVTKDATCTGGGITESKCTGCGHVRSTTTVDALGHDLKEEIIVASTCDKTGTKKFTCTRCPHSFTQTTPVKGHSYAIQTNPATCTTTGSEKTICTVCQHVKQELTLSALGHNYTSEITKEPVGLTPGIKTYTCTRCDASYTEEIKPPESIIPEGGVYEAGYYEYDTWDFIPNTYTAGQKFPEPQYGDTFTYGDYTYVYGGIELYVEYYDIDEEGAVYLERSDNNPYKYEEYDGTIYVSSYDEEALVDGWFVYATDYEQAHYDKFLTTVNNIDVVSYKDVYVGCYLVEDLSHIEIPDHITNISGMFECCFNLSKFPSLHDNIIDMSSTFEHCEKLNNITLPKNVQDISYALYDTGIETIEIPSSVTYMSYAFAYCENLKQVSKLPSQITSLSGTFSGCSSLTQAPEIPSTVTDMSYCFSWCEQITQSPLLPTGLTNMYGCFYGSAITTAPSIPNTVTSLNYAFRDCEQLTTVTEIPSSVTSMPYAFSNCKKLTGDIRVKCNLSNSSSYNYQYVFEGTVLPIRLTDNLTQTTNTETFNRLCGTSSNKNVTYDKNLIALAINNKCPTLVYIPDETLEEVEAGYTEIKLYPYYQGYSIKSFTMNGQKIKGDKFTAPYASGTIIIDNVELMFGAFAESEHYNYAHNQNSVTYLEYTCEAAESITVNLNIQTEYSFDYVLIYDYKGKSVKCPLNNSIYFGSRTMRNQTITVPGNSVTIKFRTDGSQNNFYGFDVTVTPNIPQLNTILLTSDEYVNEMNETIGYIQYPGADLIVLDMYVNIEEFYDNIYLKDRYGNILPYTHYYNWDWGQDINKQGHFTVVAETDYLEVLFQTDISVSGEEYSGFTITSTPYYGDYESYELTLYENNLRTPLREMFPTVNNDERTPLFADANDITVFYMADLAPNDLITLHEGSTQGQAMDITDTMSHYVTFYDCQTCGVGIITDGDMSWEDGYTQYKGFKIYVIPEEW